MIEQFYLIYRWHPKRYYQSGSGWTSQGNEEVSNIPSSLTGASPSDAS